MTKRDHQLGMFRPITRRDLIHGAGLAALGAGLPPAALAQVLSGDPASTGRQYPPTRTGMRGSHPGSFEVAHAMVRDGRPVPAIRDLDEDYDLVVVGAGISGLAAAHYYRRFFGPEARILILDNHDDFGGHAKRNEFHQGGKMRLSIGGTHNLELESFGDTAPVVYALLEDLGIDINTLIRQTQFDYGNRGANGPSIFFDAENYGENRLITGVGLRSGPGPKILAALDQFPVSHAARQRLKAFYQMPASLWPDSDEAATTKKLSNIPYPDFLRQYGNLREEEISLFDNTMFGTWGLSTRIMSANECFIVGMPGAHLLAINHPERKADELATPEHAADETVQATNDIGVAMFPDGNAGIARLLVQRLIPAVSPGASAENISMADFDYAQLDQPQSNTRLRLNATVLNVTEADGSTSITYASQGSALRVRARHTVLACYNSIIPYLCPQMSKPQKEALSYQVKRPLLVTNVLIRSRAPMEKLGITGTHCPGRLHGRIYLMQGNSAGGFEGAQTDDEGGACLMFWGGPGPADTGAPLAEQVRSARAKLLNLTFADYEREVRTVLDGMLGPAGFDVQRDILAITVNRWPHGYGHDYMDLWDPDYPPGEAPHEIARQRFGSIVIANTDAGADAYTHTAIAEAWRAVNELKDLTA